MNKPVLRNALRKLRGVPFDSSDPANVRMAPQEMLDFLAMAAGIKPVFLLGRGFDDTSWTSGVVAIARGMGHYLIAGPAWNAQPTLPDLPSWFQEQGKASAEGKSVFYVCRARGIAEAVRESFRHPAIEMNEEARLLGYPLCCVQEHYRRNSLLDRTFYQILKRTAGGDISEMQRLMRDTVGMLPDATEKKAFERATKLHSAPFISFYMCDDCAADPSRPAWRISRQYEELARAVDRRLAAEISAAQEGVGRYK